VSSPAYALFAALYASCQLLHLLALLLDAALIAPSACQIQVAHWTHSITNLDCLPRTRPQQQLRQATPRWIAAS
jgi:hypothetical protein